MLRDPATVMHYSKDGALDWGFGTAGSVSVSARSYAPTTGLAVQRGDRLLMTWPAENSMPKITRLSSGGHPDASFGAGDGTLQLGRPEWASRTQYANDRPSRALVLPDGRIRVPISFRPKPQSRWRMAIAGLTAAGHPDLRFGNRGLAVGPPPIKPLGEAAHTIVLDAHGNLLVAGHAQGDGFGYWGNTVVRRFRRDGELDRSFATEPTDFFGGMALLDADTLLLTTYAYDPKYRFWGVAYVARLNAGYDRTAPSIRVRVLGCRAARIRVRDLTGVRRVVVRANGRVLRRTARQRLTLRVPAGVRRISIRATDLADNVSTRRIRLPRC